MSERPVFLSLSPTRFSWPVTAMASIAHRISGVLLVAGIAWLLWLLNLAVESPAGFDRARAILTLPMAKLVLLGVLAILCYHFIAGVKHLLLDLHIGDSMAAARAGAWFTFAGAAVGTALLALWLW